MNQTTNQRQIQASSVLHADSYSPRIFLISFNRSILIYFSSVLYAKVHAERYRIRLLIRSR